MGKVIDQSVVTIANGESLSTAVSLAGTELVGLGIPAGVEGSVVTFAVSHDGVTYRTYRSTDGAEVTATLVADSNYGIAPVDFAGWRYVKVRTGTVGAPTNQTGAAAIEVQTKAVSR